LHITGERRKSRTSVPNATAESSQAAGNSSVFLRPRPRRGCRFAAVLMLKRSQCRQRRFRRRPSAPPLGFGFSVISGLSVAREEASTGCCVALLPNVASRHQQDNRHNYFLRASLTARISSRSRYGAGLLYGES